ncbi:MAG: hypothetical protein ABH878_08780 [bacterium]
MEKWQRRRILIWGKTRPELSKTYREVVCTGGVFNDTKRLVRLYPIPLRYIDDEHVFKKYQWIEANVVKAQNDPRPESYKINPEGIYVDNKVETSRGNWDARAVWILNDQNVFKSVEALQERQLIDQTSLGLVKPFRILDIQAQPFSQQEKNEFWKNYLDAVSQMNLPLDSETNREIKPLTPPDYRFRINFTCADAMCNHGHSFRILDWELDALYFNLLQRGNSKSESAAKVVQKLHEICAPDKDLYFFLGNISNHLHIFTIVGLWYPKKTAVTEQQQLFSK